MTEAEYVAMQNLEAVRITKLIWSRALINTDEKAKLYKILNRLESKYNRKVSGSLD